LLTAAATLDLQHGAGLHWLVQHLPPRTTPIATTVMPGDDPGVVLLAAGPQGCAAGPAQAVTGGDSHEVDIESLADLFAPRLQAFLPPGAVAAARCTPVPQIGSWVV
jgi:hypothetical protein